MGSLERIGLADIRAAGERIAGKILRTPLLKLEQDQVPAEIYLKLENLQPGGSFKLRGALSAMGLLEGAALRGGVSTASAGNMAQAVALGAQRLGIPCRVLVPERAPKAKLEGIRRFGAELIRVPFDEWWRVMETHEHPALMGSFIHPVCDARVIAGNGTIGLEILEDLPDVDTVVVPFGGGGLSAGIAIALRGAGAQVRLCACEVESAAPLAASLRAGAPMEIDYRPSFVDGIGGKSVLPAMWPLVSTLLSESLVVSLEEVARAVRLLVERCRVVAEGAGAAPVAAAVGGRAGSGKIVCVVSGGNIDPGLLSSILTDRQGEIV